MSFIERLHSTINTLTMQYLQMTQQIYIKCSQFHNCSVRIVYQVTLHNKCSKYPLLESTHTWTHMNMDSLTISQVLVRLQWFNRHKRCIGVVSCHFQLELNTSGPLRVPSDVNTFFARASENVCRHILI